MTREYFEIHVLVAQRLTAERLKLIKTYLITTSKTGALLFGSCRLFLFTTIPKKYHKSLSAITLPLSMFGHFLMEIIRERVEFVTFYWI